MSRNSGSRRDFLKAAAAGGLMAGYGAPEMRLGQGALLAQSPASDRRFVFVYIPGGWDLLLTLDPREFELDAADQSAYRQQVELTQIDTQYRFGPGAVNSYAAGTYFAPTLYRPTGSTDPFYFGPGVVGTSSDGTPVDEPSLWSLASEGVPMSIIRGINMGTLGHEQGYLYGLTGEPAVGSDGRGSNMSVRIASALGHSGDGTSPVVVPVVAMGVQSFTGHHPGRYGAFMISNITDVERMLSRPEALGEQVNVEQALAEFARGREAVFTDARDPTGLARQLSGSQERAEQLLESDLADRFRFLYGDDEESQQMRGLYGVNEGSDPLSPGVVAGFAAQSIKHGLSQFVSVGFTKNNVDTHGTSNPGHLNGLYPCLRAISALTKDLAETPADAELGGSWLDHTTIVVFSEFGRTPMHNVHGGRDHHFLNAALLIGAGVQANAVVGASTETGGMQPRYFDLDDQVLLGEGATPANERQRYILPEDVGATLLASAGLDYSEYRFGTPLWGAITEPPF